MIATPWGNIEVADAHVHFFSPAFFASLGEKAPLLGWDAPSSPEDLARKWIAELDRNGVDRALLIASIPNDSASVEAAVELDPERLAAVSMTNPLLPHAPSTR